MLTRSSELRIAHRRRRHRRIRARLHGTAQRPRLSVFRSKKRLFLQLVDDVSGLTLVAVHDVHLQENAGTSSDGRSGGVARAFALGKLLAVLAGERGITTVVFDRGGYAYHGRVQAVADGARAGGMTF